MLHNLQNICVVIDLTYNCRAFNCYGFHYFVTGNNNNTSMSSRQSNTVYSIDTFTLVYRGSNCGTIHCSLLSSDGLPSSRLQIVELVTPTIKLWTPLTPPILSLSTKTSVNAKSLQRRRQHSDQSTPILCHRSAISQTHRMPPPSQMTSFCNLFTNFTLTSQYIILTNDMTLYKGYCAFFSPGKETMD